MQQTACYRDSILIAMHRSLMNVFRELIKVLQIVTITKYVEGVRACQDQSSSKSYKHKICSFGLQTHMSLLKVIVAKRHDFRSGIAR
jgi:hypothetical protein